MKDQQEQDIHAKVVNDWEKQTAKDLTPQQHIRLLQMAILAIEKRALMTLSSITLMAIQDRVLHQSKQKFPLLMDIKILNRVLDFKTLNESIHDHQYQEMIAALRYLLVEQLKILGRITADILTVHLHKELQKVSWNDLEQA